MNPRIRILPEQLANQIAAGEVVERPASVVKELLENAIDAGASELLIEVEQGGKRLIRVTDNGCGMGKEDLFLAMERHATSKIATAADLFALQTLGFRGEALPSIASVSRLRLTSRPAEQDLGWQLYAEGGVVRQAEAIGSASGTVVEVRDLFFNTPGRRKFLRGDDTEFGHLADVVMRQALARPDIQMRLIHNGKTHLEAYRHRHIAERAAAILGRTMTADLLELETSAESGEMLGGLIGSPSLNRSSSSYVFTYVNGRFVRDRVVQHAILDGYRTLLEKRRFPVAVLFLDLPPEQVDVNVHPTKHEVRFRHQQQVHDFVAESIRERLLAASRPAFAAIAGDTAVGRLAEITPQPAQAALAGVREALATYAARQAVPSFAGVRNSDKGEALAWQPTPVSSTSVSDEWRVIGQYLNSYLVCQAGEDLLLVDQHAAHERIGFEKLRHQLQSGGIEMQRLLLPVVIECDHRQAAAISDHLAEFARFGFELEPFGGRSFNLLAVPQLLSASDPERLLLDMAEELVTIGRGCTLDSAFEQVLLRLACHTMLRASQALSRSEMEALLSELAAIDFGSHCPHGRPVCKRLRRGEIERFFHRG